MFLLPLEDNIVRNIRKLRIRHNTIDMMTFVAIYFSILYQFGHFLTGPRHCASTTLHYEFALFFPSATYSRRTEIVEAPRVCTQIIPSGRLMAS